MGFDILAFLSSTFIDPDTRRAMGEQAVSLAKAVGYSSAGEQLLCRGNSIGGNLVVDFSSKRNNNSGDNNCRRDNTTPSVLPSYLYYTVV